MKHRVLLAAVVGATAFFSPQSADAFFGLLRGKKDAPAATTGGCGAATVADCGGCATPVADCGGCGLAAPTGAAVGGCGGVSYATQTVTRMVPTTTTTKQKVNVTDYQWVDEPYQYQVCKPVVTKQKVNVTDYQWVDEPYQYQVSRPVTAMVPTPVTRTVCMPTQVTSCVPVSKQVMVATCGGCGAVVHACQTVTEMHAVTKTVMQMQTVTEMVNVCQTTYTTEMMSGVRKVCKPVVTQKDMDVTTMQWVTENGVRKVCKPVVTQKEMDVTTTTFTAVTEVVPVSGCGTVYAPVAAPATCDDPCAEDKKPARKGLFGRLFGR